jgi:hypothetical protein
MREFNEGSEYDPVDKAAEQSSEYKISHADMASDDPGWVKVLAGLAVASNPTEADRNSLLDAERILKMRIGGLDGVIGAGVTIEKGLSTDTGLDGLQLADLQRHLDVVQKALSDLGSE